MLTEHAALPVVLGLASAVIWGGADFAGGLAARRAPAGWVVLVAHGSSVVALAGLIALLHPVPLAAHARPVAVLSGITGGIGLMFFYRALATGAMGLSAALAGVLTAALPVSVALVEQGRPGAWQLAGFVVAALAIALIAWAPGEAPQLRTLALSTVAGIGFGSQLVLLHAAAEDGSSLRSLMLSRIGGVAMAAAAVAWSALRARFAAGTRVVASTPDPTSPQPSFTATDHAAGSKSLASEARLTGTSGPPRAFPRPLAAFLFLSLLTGVLDTAGNGLYMASALAGRLDVAAVLASLYPGATILLAAWLLHERTSRLQTLGMALALLAVALISA